MLRILLLTVLISSVGMQNNRYTTERNKMVDEQIVTRGIKNPQVLEAMRQVHRHAFVPAELQHMAYTDQPLPIGHNQTISQPYIVAFMTEALHLEPTYKVLEIGTGSGYQAAVLAEIVSDVYTIEIVSSLAAQAEKTLSKLNYKNIEVISGDGYQGHALKAPYDAIIVTAAPNHIPIELIKQLKVGGRMIIPVGPVHSIQQLVLVTKNSDGVSEKKLMPVRFVPFTGKASEKE